MLPNGAYSKYGPGILHWVANADIAAGQIIQHPVGKVGVLNNDAENGKLTALDTLRQVEATNSGVTFAAGDDVGWDSANRHCVAGGLGDFNIGKAVNAAGTSDKVLVLLNS